MFSFTLDEIDNVSRILAQAKGIVQVTGLMDAPTLPNGSLNNAMWAVDTLIEQVQTIISNRPAVR